jgi:hypothetical protein
VRQVTFRWTVDATNVQGPVRTAVALFDGINWLTAASQSPSPGSTLVEDTMRLTPGTYRWRVRTLEPVGCEPEMFEDGPQFVVPTCCPDQASLIGQLRIFSVENALPKFDLTEQQSEGGCVTTDSVIVAVPEGTCAVEVEWESPAVADPRARTRTLPMALPADGSPIEVKARVNVAGCRATVLSVRVRSCATAREPQRQTPWFCGGDEWCPLFEALAIYPIIGVFLSAALGLFFVTFGLAVSVAVAATIAGPPIVLGITFFTAMLFVNVFITCTIVIIVGHVLWWRCCTPSVCRWLEDVEWALQWSVVLCTLIPIAGWFFLPLQALAFFVIRSMMIGNRCNILRASSLPHVR